MIRTGTRLGLIGLILITIGCDRVTKHLAAVALSEAPAHSFMMDTVRLEYAENAGAFLGLGATWPAVVRTGLFTVGNAILLLVVVVAAARDRWSGPVLVGTALLVAGGASNLVDRIARGRVIDFMNVGIGPLRTGIFNVADMAVLLGAIIVAFTTWRSTRKTHARSE
jgi:signal peptidase II